MEIRYEVYRACVSGPQAHTTHKGAIVRWTRTQVTVQSGKIERKFWILGKNAGQQVGDRSQQWPLVTANLLPGEAERVQLGYLVKGSKRA